MPRTTPPTPLTPDRSRHTRPGNTVGSDSTAVWLSAQRAKHNRRSGAQRPSCTQRRLPQLPLLLLLLCHAREPAELQPPARCATPQAATPPPPPFCTALPPPLPPPPPPPPRAANRRSEDALTQVLARRPPCAGAHHSSSGHSAGSEMDSSSRCCRSAACSKCLQGRSQAEWHGWQRNDSLSRVRGLALCVERVSFRGAIVQQLNLGGRPSCQCE